MSQSIISCINSSKYYYAMLPNLRIPRIESIKWRLAILSIAVPLSVSILNTMEERMYYHKEEASISPPLSSQYSSPIIVIALSIIAIIWSKPSLRWMPRSHHQMRSPLNPNPTSCCHSMLIIIGVSMNQYIEMQSSGANQVPRIEYNLANLFGSFQTASRNLLAQSLYMFSSNPWSLSISLENKFTTYGASYSCKYQE